ncbi:MAG: pyruvate formate-lyase [Clostridiales bacterium]|nr:pyruvate formate-lyase [Clostridiales bacterium]
MNSAIERLLDYVKSQKHRIHRRELTKEESKKYASEFQIKGMPLIERFTRRFELFMAAEKPVILPYTRIHGLRTIIEFPDIYCPGELEEIRKTHYIHEDGKVCHLAYDYKRVIHNGLASERNKAKSNLEGANEKEREFLLCVIRCIDAIEGFAKRYADELRRLGRSDEADRLFDELVYGAKTLIGAMQSFRILHFAIWVSGNYNAVIGRIDQDFYPYYLAEKAKGVSDEEIQNLVEDFLLSFNLDNDLYYSLAWGDNGQSVTLGGCTETGACAVNELTTICLEASLNIRLIDPKINLRVSSSTPLELYELGTKLTRTGLGFPQYMNDDIIIKGLERLGYETEDARNYVAGACWEPIIPAVGFDIPNIDGIPMALIVKETITNHLEQCKSMDELLQVFSKRLKIYINENAENHRNLYMEPSPISSLLMSNCIENRKDISEGTKYNNYGYHGTGFSNAVDQLAAVEAYVFGDGSISANELIAAMEDNYAKTPEMKYKLSVEAPKIGRDKKTKGIGDKILNEFAKALQGMKNERGGIYRPGTGSAMYHVWHIEGLGATADGRDADTPLAANFSPSLGIKGSGPFSVIDGFSLPSLWLTPNGGPLTLELHDTVFDSEDAITKIALLVQTFIEKGGHQLQLNAVNGEQLIDAQAHPEQYQDLIVRVWGWSGYFVELDKEYQDQIIQRTSYGI